LEGCADKSMTDIVGRIEITLLSSGFYKIVLNGNDSWEVSTLDDLLGYISLLVTPLVLSGNSKVDIQSTVELLREVQTVKDG